MENHVTRFASSRQALAAYTESAEELKALKLRAQFDMFEALKDAVIEGTQGNTDYINKILSDELPKLDDWNRKKLLSSYGLFKGKEKQVKMFFSKEKFKDVATNSLDYRAFAESLRNPYIEQPKEKTEKSVEENRQSLKKVVGIHFQGLFGIISADLQTAYWPTDCKARRSWRSASAASLSRRVV